MTDVAPQYLAALGLEPGPPTRALLEEVVRRHVATFAFTSVGPRLGDELPLAPEALLDRIVVRRRGGYCFEQNGLAYAALAELGYAPRLYLARVLLSGDPHPGLTHRVTVVDLDGAPHLVDVGFGAPGPHLPVPLDGAEVGSRWRRFRVAELRPGHLHLQRRYDGDWRSLYRFELLEYGANDCEVGHFYSHRHPEAAFVTTLVGSTIHEEEERSLVGLDYRVTRPDGVEQRTVSSAPELRRLYADELGVEVSEQEAVRLYQDVEP